MSNEQKEREQKTSLSTIHYLKVEIVLPENLLADYRTVTLRPVRFTSSDGSEMRYAAYIRLRHPPFTRRTPLEIDFETAQTYHQNGVIDQTTCRILIVDPAEDIEIVDVTKDVKMEKKQDERKSEQSSSSQPSICPYCANIHDDEVTAIILTLT